MRRFLSITLSFIMIFSAFVTTTFTATAADQDFSMNCTYDFSFDDGIGMPYNNDGKTNLGSIADDSTNPGNKVWNTGNYSKGKQGIVFDKAISAGKLEIKYKQYINVQTVSATSTTKIMPTLSMQFNNNALWGVSRVSNLSLFANSTLQTDQTVVNNTWYEFKAIIDIENNSEQLQYRKTTDTDWIVANIPQYDSEGKATKTPLHYFDGVTYVNSKGETVIANGTLLPITGLYFSAFNQGTEYKNYIDDFSVKVYNPLYTAVNSATTGAQVEKYLKSYSNMFDSIALSTATNIDYTAVYNGLLNQSFANDAALKTKYDALCTANTDIYVKDSYLYSFEDDVTLPVDTDSNGKIVTVDNDKVLDLGNDSKDIQGIKLAAPVTDDIIEIKYQMYVNHELNKDSSYKYNAALTFMGSDGTTSMVGILLKPANGKIMGGNNATTSLAGITTQANPACWYDFKVVYDAATKTDRIFYKLPTDIDYTLIQQQQNVNGTNTLMDYHAFNDESSATKINGYIPDSVQYVYFNAFNGNTVYKNYIDDLSVTVYNQMYSLVNQASTAASVETCLKKYSDVGLLELTNSATVDYDAVYAAIAARNDFTSNEQVQTAYNEYCTQYQISDEQTIANYASFNKTSLTANDIYTYSLSDSQKENVASSVVLVNVTLKADTKCTPVKIALKNAANEVISEETYYAPVQNTKITLPLDVDVSLAAVELNTENGVDNISISDFNIAKYNSKTVEDLKVLTGMHITDDFTEGTLSYSDGQFGQCVDMQIVGDYMYSIGGGKLTVSQITGSGLNVVGTLEYNFGEMRQLAVTSDGKTGVITARQDGAYIVDLTNKSNPQLITRWDTVELATGVCVSGDYAYICCRTFAVEIINISDPYHAKSCGSFRCSDVDTSIEIQSCYVEDGIFYGGVWEKQSLIMVDVKNPYKPNVLSIYDKLHGRGDGIYIVDFPNSKKYAFCATGQMSQDNSYTSPSTVLSYGQGNGFDIIDVTDPANPTWVSTSKCEGRFYYPSVDFWDVRVAKGSDNRYYAYTTNTYNGGYVYDVTDPSAPVRIAHIFTKIPNGTAGYRDISSSSSGRTIVLPFDNSEYFQEPYTAVEAADGKLYFAGYYSGIQTYDLSCAYDVLSTDDTSVYNPQMVENSYKIPTDSNISELKIYAPENKERVYAAQAKGGYIYAACGMKGIVVLDEDMNEVNTISCGDGIAMDLRIYGDYLLTAETSNGMGIYHIDGTKLTKVGSYLDSSYAVRSVRSDSNLKYALIQLGVKQLVVVDISNLSNPVAVESTRETLGGMLYYKNLTDEFIVDGEHIYAGGCANAGTNVWYDLGGETPVLVSDSVTAYISLRGGLTGYKDRFLGTYSTSLVLIDPTNTAEQYEKKISISGMSDTTADSSILYYTGKPYIRGDLLIECDKQLGLVSIIDISDINHPYVIYKTQFGGNCDIATATDDYILIPAGQQGLVKLVLKNIQPSFKVTKTDDGDNIKITVDSKSYNINNKDLQIVVAQYDEDNDMINSSIGAKSRFTYNEFTGNNEISIPKDSNAKYIKVFTFDNIDTIKPYAEMQVIELTNN